MCCQDSAHALCAFVLQGTVRCEATKTNPETAKEDLDLPALLKRHFPQHGYANGVWRL